MIKMYGHSGSKNHGCEAIVRSTLKILHRDDVVLFSKAIEDDKLYGIQNLCQIEYDDNSVISKKSIEYLKMAFGIRFLKSSFYEIKYIHKNFFSKIHKDDICLSIGGDNYCYDGAETFSHYNREIHNKKGKTVLWGCSIEPSMISKDIAKDLSRYDMIISRESISYETLKQYNKNTFLFPDPAFQLDSVELSLPDGFIEGNTVGLNVSPLIMNYEKAHGVTLKNYVNLVDYIIGNTDMQVALIPHVVIKEGDDRGSLEKIYNIFKDTGRVIKIKDCNCEELKGYIKRCRFIITARTHASVAAYSTCIPTIVVGYSVKAKGIAKDIFGNYEDYVLSVQNLIDDNALVNKFIWMMKNEDKIKGQLNKFMPDYCKRALLSGEKIKELL